MVDIYPRVFDLLLIHSFIHGSLLFPNQWEIIIISLYFIIFELEYRFGNRLLARSSPSTGCSKWFYPTKWFSFSWFWKTSLMIKPFQGFGEFIWVLVLFLNTAARWVQVDPLCGILNWKNRLMDFSRARLLWLSNQKMVRDWSRSRSY